MLPPSAQVCPIELPGRGRRAGEPAVSSVMGMADQLCQALPLQVIGSACLHAACQAIDKQFPSSCHFLSYCIPSLASDLHTGIRDPFETSLCLQDKPYALFGTCLGAITCYELAQSAVRAGLPGPVALFTAAVSPPHIYAGAVMKLYVKPAEASAEASLEAEQGAQLEEVLRSLEGWESLPKELVLQVILTCELMCFFEPVASQFDHELSAIAAHTRGLNRPAFKC